MILLHFMKILKLISSLNKALILRYSFNLNIGNPIKKKLNKLYDLRKKK